MKNAPLHYRTLTPFFILSFVVTDYFPCFLSGRGPLPLFKKKSEITRVRVFNDPLPWWKERNDRFFLVANVIRRRLLLHSQIGRSQQLVKLSRIAAAALGGSKVELLLGLQTVRPELENVNDNDHNGNRKRTKKRT